jgi:hypothetical protein
VPDHRTCAGTRSAVQATCHVVRHLRVLTGFLEKSAIDSLYSYSIHYAGDKELPT